MKELCSPLNYAVFTFTDSCFPYGKIAEAPVRLFVVLEGLGDLGDRSDFESLLLVFVFLLLCVLPDFNGMLVFMVTHNHTIIVTYTVFSLYIVASNKLKIF